MRHYSEAVKADVRRRMSPPLRQYVDRICEELGIHVDILYNCREAWRLQGEVVLASEQDPDGLSAADKFTLVLETAGLTPLNLVPTGVSGGCTRSRWNVGVRPPRMPTRSQCSPCRRSPASLPSRKSRSSWR